jgi:RecA-family ATPase
MSHSGHQFEVTFFPDEKAQSKIAERLTLTELRDKILTTTAADKGSLPLFKLASFGKQRTERNCLRSDANVIEIYGVELDHDTGLLTFEDALRIAQEADVQCLIYKSPGFRPEKQKWRALFPTSHALPPGERKALATRAAGVFGPIFDPASFTLSQSFYFGSVNNNPEHEAVIIEGDFIDERQDLDAIEKASPGPANPFLDYGRGSHYGPSVDVDARLAAMTFKGKDDASIHWTQLQVSAALVASGVPTDQIVDRILQRTLEVVGEEGSAWDWEAEENKIRKMCEDAEKKGFRETKDKETKTPLPKLDWLDMSAWDMLAVPPRKWAIEDRVPLNQAGLVSGEGGTGKSIIELMKNVAHVAGKDWLGSMPEKGPAFYIGAEDEADEIHRRLASITQHYGVSFSALVRGGLHVLCKLGEDATLCHMTKSGKVETTAFYDQLYEAAGDIKPKNISIDTLSRAFAGNEIDRVQVYAFAMHMQALAMVAGGSVTILSHPSLQGIASGSGFSGSTAWHGAFRFRQFLTGLKPEAGGEPPDSDVRELRFLKNQYGPRGETILLRYQNGLFLPEVGLTDADRLARAEHVDAVFLKGLGQLLRQGQDAIAGSSSPAYGPAVIAEMKEAKETRVTKKELVEALRRLLEANKVHIGNTSGAPSKAKKCILPGNGWKPKAEIPMTEEEEKTRLKERKQYQEASRRTPEGIKLRGQLKRKWSKEDKAREL